MFRLSASILALAFAASSVSAQATVNSINPVQCQPVAITWSGATGDVFLSVVQGSDVASAPLRTFPTQSGASGTYTWSPVDVPAGTEITIVINDGTGQQNFSGQSTVAQGNDDCNPTLNKETASGSAAPGSPSATESGSSASPTSSGDNNDNDDNDDNDNNSSSPAGASATPSGNNNNNNNNNNNDDNGASGLKMNSGLTLAFAGVVGGLTYGLF